jgi:tRNA uridine 5-carboxymethylaminomethyl modification enzyme
MLSTQIPEITMFSERVRSRVWIEAVYAPYVQQQQAAMKVFQKDESLRLPLDLEYERIHGLSMHEKSLLRATRPESLGQARRIEGLTPSGCLSLLAYVQSSRRAARKTLEFETMLESVVPKLTI